MNPADFSGRRILVTGGSHGIGLEVSRQLARHGATVVVCARDPKGVKEAVATLEGVGHHGISLDVSEDGAWRGALEDLDALGPVTGLVTAAGVLGPIGRLEEIDPAAFAETIHVNLIGTMLALHHTLPRLRAFGGRAVTFSGGGGTSPLAHYDAYAASKAGVIRLTENVAASGDVEINCVAPGFVATRMHAETLAAGPARAGSAYYERTRAQLSEGGFPVDVAAALVCHLLSDAAAGVSGRLISAQWDPWRDSGFLDALRADRSLATLRRIDGQLFRRADE